MMLVGDAQMAAFLVTAAIPAAILAHAAVNPGKGGK